MVYITLNAWRVGSLLIAKSYWCFFLSNTAGLGLHYRLSSGGKQRKLDIIAFNFPEPEDVNLLRFSCPTDTVSGKYINRVHVIKKSSKKI